MQKVSHIEHQNLIGGYYTEKYIAKILVKHSLRQWFSDCLYIQEKIPSNDSLTYEDNLFLKISQKQRIKLKQKLRNTKILDPAVGAGVFLIESAKYLEKIYQVIYENPSDQENLRLSIVENHLFGWDIKEIAIETTKNELAKWIMGKKPVYYESYNDLELNMEKTKIKFPKDLNNLSDKSLISKIKGNFIVKNALNLTKNKSEDEKRDYYSIIIGNPPYGNIISHDEQVRLKDFYKCRKTEISELFVELGLDYLLKNDIGGILSFILPKTITYYQKWSKCRELLISNNVLEIYDLGIAFPNVNLEQIAIILRKNKPNQKKIEETQSIAVGSFFPQKKFPKTSYKILGIIPYNLILKHKTLIFIPLTEKELKLVNYINENCIFLPDIADNSNKKMFSSSLKRSIYFKNEVKARFTKGSQLFLNKVPDIKAFLIKRLYRIKLQREKNFNTYLYPKILFKVLRGSRLACFADFKGDILSTEKVVNFFPNEHYQKYLFGLQVLLNSRPASFYLQAIQFNQTTETSRVLDAFYAAKIPIPKCNDKILEFLNKIGKLLILCNYQDDQKLTSLLTEIAEVYSESLYFSNLYTKLFKNSSIFDILDIQSNPYLNKIFELTQNDDFTKKFDKILDIITQDPPLSDKRTPNPQFIQNIWGESIKKELNENINHIFDYYKLRDFKNTWIHRSLNLFLGK